MRLAESTKMTTGARVIWKDLGEDEHEGEPQRLSDYPSKTVTIDGGQARLVGKNWDHGEWHELTDAQGMPIKGPGIAHFTLNPWEIKPVLISGSHVTVTIVATKGG